MEKMGKKEKMEVIFLFHPSGQVSYFPSWEADFWGGQIPEGWAGAQSFLLCLGVSLWKGVSPYEMGFLSLWNGGRGLGEWISPVHNAQSALFLLEEGKAF